MYLLYYATSAPLCARALVLDRNKKKASLHSVYLSSTMFTNIMTYVYCHIDYHHNLLYLFILGILQKITINNENNIILLIGIYSNYNVAAF